MILTGRSINFMTIFLCYFSSLLLFLLSSTAFITVIAATRDGHKLRALLLRWSDRSRLLSFGMCQSHIKNRVHARLIIMWENESSNSFSINPLMMMVCDESNSRSITRFFLNSRSPYYYILIEKCFDWQLFGAVQCALTIHTTAVTCSAAKKISFNENEE